MRVMAASAPPKVVGRFRIPVSAVLMRTALISFGVRPGKALRSNAAEPATIGDAPDVPPNAWRPVAVPTSADTDAPGAPISGLTRFSIEGPRDDDPTMTSTSGIVLAGSNRTWIVAMLFRNRLPTDWLTM